MGWDNPPVPWREFERRLSWRGSSPGKRAGGPGRGGDTSQAGGGKVIRLRQATESADRPALPADGPAPLADEPAPQATAPWAELHCHSCYSFLDGASSPEELIAEAAERGLSALAITDHDGMYGVPQFAQAAARLWQRTGIQLGTVFGAELSLLTAGQALTAGRMAGQARAAERAGSPDPAGQHLLVLARDPEGYRRLCQVISAAQLAGGEKGRPVYDLAELAGAHDGHWVILTGCRKGAVPAALAAGESGGWDSGGLGAGGWGAGGWGAGGLDSGGLAAAEAELRWLADAFGRQNVVIELISGTQPADDERNDALYELATRTGTPVVATNNVHYATPADARLAQALAAIRARRSLDEMDCWLDASGGAYIRSGAEMARLLRRYPGVLERTVRLAAECAFSFSVIAPRLPDFPVPAGHTEISWLRELVRRKAPRRYGPLRAERVKGAYRQIARELDVIEQLGFPGYFLIVHDIVEFCERKGILCQGRGSAANSAVCFAVGITSVDPVLHGLLFERFLSAGRDGPPDIDLDIEHRRREEVIQYVYQKYGRRNAAQVANVISYRPRMALRDAGRALGHDPEELGAWSRQIGPRPYGEGQLVPPDAGIPPDVSSLAERMQRLPRHLGIHSGGMVICDRPVGEVCPVEWARMPGRSVLQWDKDDCAYAGLVKFDLLGLGMLTALRDCFELVEKHYGERWTLGTIPQEDPAVYEMLRAADTVGVFQVESRAQMATLPRLRPERFYDLVIEVALIRPGPIQGGSVHPYLRRRHGEELAELPHPLMKRALDKTLGVPLFQEQMMQIAIDCAGFSPTEADRLRQAMSSKRAPERIEELRARLLDGMSSRGIPSDVAQDIYEKILAFSSYGFPESHAISFAYLVYASAWLKRYYPAAFTAALLRAQPMGFYAPATLIADARRHGVEVRRADVNASGVDAILEGHSERISGRRRPARGGRTAGGPAGSPAVGPAGGSSATGGSFGSPAAGPAGGGRAAGGSAGSPAAGPAIRLGLSNVRNLGSVPAAAIVAGQPYAGLEDFARRTRLAVPALEALATAGALGCFGIGRREALWAAGAMASIRADQLPGTTAGLAAPALPPMTAAEETFADLWATGTYGTHPIEHIRSFLAERGVIPAADLAAARPGSAVAVGGLVTHRQQPGTAGGVVFLSLEDETGMINVICPPPVWQRYRRLAVDASALVVRGRVERLDGAVSLLAGQLHRLRVVAAARSRDFR